MGKELFDFISRLYTEQRNPETAHIDVASPLEIVRLMNRQDALVAEKVGEKDVEIAQAISFAAEALAGGGRLIYVGAGTSGRLGVIDAAECPPTFGTDPSQVVGLIAGGPAAMFVAQEGAEDSEDLGKSDLAALQVNEKDVVCGLAASGRTPYVWGAMEYASQQGAKTVLVCCVPASQLPDRKKPDVIIDVATGPEVIMGSTRLKSATAQKMICNMISSGAMIQLGKVFGNVMVDLKLTNKKLVERAIKIIMMFTSLTYPEAAALLVESGNHVKTALVMYGLQLNREDARRILDQQNGFISRVLQATK